MKILMIGGTGVLSTDILERSLECGYEVSVINRGNHTEQIPENVTIYKANIRDINDVKQKIRTKTFDVIVDFLSYNKSDLQTTFDYFKNKCTQYIFISSACVFRRNKEDGILLENSPKPNLNLPYSIGKYECEKWLIRNGNDSHCKYTIVRPYITYGNTRIPFGIAPLARYHWTIVSRILNDKPMFLWDDGIARCTLTHTKDFAYNFVQLYLNEKVYGEDINLVGEQVCTWREMLETLYEILNKDKNNIISIPTEIISKILPCFKDFLIGDRALDAVFDNSKLKKSIPDYRYSISLRQGLSTTIDFYKRNAYLSGIDYKYDGRIDKLVKYVTGRRYGFVDYLNSRHRKDRFIYEMYRHVGENTLSSARLLAHEVKKLSR
jgi:nucleoside-diphosphate-sugar epimerase